MLTRRSFVRTLAVAPFISRPTPTLNTVTGPISSSKLGLTLIHEHILVDFVGADKINPSRWEREKVVAKMLPHLHNLKRLGVATLIDCTPAYLGKDPLLLRELSEKSGVQLVTNTGY